VALVCSPILATTAELGRSRNCRCKSLATLLIKPDRVADSAPVRWASGGETDRDQTDAAARLRLSSVKFASVSEMGGGGSGSGLVSS
jgi:hypothetical protein